jgi:uncharacterized protein (UPF0548 family)
MWLLHQPSDDTIRTFLASQASLPFSYPEVGASRDGAPAGYAFDHNRALLGQGRDIFEAACAALCRWEMFPRPWTRIHPIDTPLEPGRAVAMLARIFGTWCLNACRIVSVIDEATPVRCFGFAYGTLPGHVESGEERFLVEWLADDSVWYDLRAFSRPRSWMARLGYPLARRLQRRFARDSKAAMQAAVARAVPPAGVGAGPPGG